jgi:tripartite-type tricarboxylate transporter receptor subunit TctC
MNALKSRESMRKYRLIIPALSVLGFSLFAMALQPATAQSFPSRPLKMIVPFAPGGSTDVAGRILAAEMSNILGQQIVVENRAGAAGVIGIEAVARSAPDGYTMGISGMSPSVLAQISGPKPAFTNDELSFVGHAGIVEMIIVADPRSPYTTLKQAIDAARDKPGSLTYGVGANGSMAHLAFELMKNLAKVDIRAITYKGDGPAMSDLVAGHIPFASVSVAGALPLVSGGKARALAVMSGSRSPAMPDVPTVAEAGLPGFEATTFNLLAVPAKTPTAIVARLNAALNEAMGKVAVRNRFVEMGMVPVLNTPQQTTDLVAKEMVKWAAVIKQANIPKQ